MKAVVDTNVIAYFLLGTEPFRAEASRFWRGVTEPQAPALWEAEVANVMWMAVRTKALTAEEGLKRLTQAGSLGITSVPNRALWHGASEKALRAGVAAYDTLFVELATREDVPLATFDTKLIRAFPAIARRPADLS